MPGEDYVIEACPDDATEQRIRHEVIDEPSLKALNKERGTRILVSESTPGSSPAAASFTALGEATVRGKSEPVPVYAVTA